MGKLVFIRTEDNLDHILTRLRNETRVGDVIEAKPPTRNLEQNALLWPLLTEVSRKVEWYGTKLNEWEWKDVFTSALKKSKVVPGIDGGFVVCGQSTSKMSKADFSELIELIYAFGTQHGVDWQR
jgi:hypothetical protein